MNKSEIKDRMNFKMKGGSFCFSILHEGQLFFKFNDGTNDIISLDQYDDNLKCTMDKWSIESVWNYQLMPSTRSLPKIFKVKDFKNDEIYMAHYNDVDFYDGKDVTIEMRTCNFNECEGRIDNTLYPEEVVKYYIFNKYGEKIYVDSIVLMAKDNCKETLSYNSLCNNFEYIESV